MISITDYEYSNNTAVISDVIIRIPNSKTNKQMLVRRGSRFLSSRAGGGKSNSFGLTGNPDDPSWVKMTCSRSNLRAVGWEDDDMSKPVITVAAPVSTIMPCNHHHKELAERVCDEVEQRGGKASICFTPVISDGQTQGTDAMRYSLISRDYIADCIEIMHEGYYADAIITLGGCDKTVPGVAMPLPRLNLIGKIDTIYMVFRSVVFILRFAARG